MRFHFLQYKLPPIKHRGAFVLVNVRLKVGGAIIEMQSTEEKPVLRCDTILVSSRGITEACGNKVVIFVPAGEINRIVLKFGRSDHRPILSLVIGTVLALVGGCGLIGFIVVPRGYRFELGMIAFGAIGMSLIFDALKERYFFEIYQKNDMRRVVFSKQAQKKDIDGFCNDVRSTYNYQIEEVN